MMNHLGLIQGTTAYKIIKNDKKQNCLSHSYLIISKDAKYLREYLKIFAKLIMCENDDFCDTCRTCMLIEKESFTDVKFYPENDKKIIVENIDELVEDSFVKPFEADKKIYVLSSAENMTPQAQNKLLKTLEEPPKNVHILIGATNEYSLLPTIKSRVKKLEIPLFTVDKIFNEIEKDYDDKDRLTTAICSADGTVGKAEELYQDNDLLVLNNLALDLVINLNSSADALSFCNKIAKVGEKTGEFLDVLELLFRDMLIAKEQGEKFVQNKKNYEKVKINVSTYVTASIINAINAINEAKKRRTLNANDSMVTEWLLFQILEGKYKWQKL